MRSRVVVLLAVLGIALTSCSQAGHGPSASSSSGAPSASQLSPAGAREVFARFLDAFKEVESTHSNAAARQLMAGPELAAQNFQPTTAFTGPMLTSLTDQRVFVPRMSGYPRWFVATGSQSPQVGTPDFAFLFTQAASGKPWLDTMELFDLGQPGQDLPSLTSVTTDARGYASAVPSGDASLAVPPDDLPGKFSTYFDAAVSHSSTAPPAYSNYIIAEDQQAEQIAGQYGWSIADQLQATTSPVYVLRLSDGGAAVFYLTREDFTWQAESATAALSAPQSAYDISAVPDPSVIQTLGITSVRVGLRINLSLIDEHVAIDPPGSGSVSDYFNGKSLAWTAS